MNTAEWATSVGIQPVTCPDHPLPTPRYESLPPTHKPADDGEWASERDMDAAGDRYFQIREPS